MAAVGIATATAGIIVGTVTLTGIGLVMTEIVEFLSAGNFVVMLVLVAVICIVLGTGLPTTASYVVVATLMAPVMVEIAALNDLVVPLIAVHMFVFYFGLMADVSPPVGLAAYAAGAIAGADPMQGRLAGDDLRIAHRAAAVHLHLQPGTAADRHPRAAALRGRGRGVDPRHGRVRGGHAALAAGAQPPV